MSTLHDFLDDHTGVPEPLISGTPHELADLVRTVLTPDLLKKEYRAENETNPMFGHCYVATEALYYLLNDPNRYGPARGKDNRGIVHWWIVDNFTGDISDVTADQYYSIGKEPPYEAGKRSGFLTNTPSKRCQTVLERLGIDHKNLKFS